MVERLQDYAVVHDAPARRVPLPRPRWRTVMGLLLGLAIVAGALVVINSPLMEIRSVRVVGTSHISAEGVRQLAGLGGENILLADLAGARNRILAQPLVKDVRVAREWPNGAVITVMERTPWARWDVDGATWAIDDEGVVLEGLPAPRDAPQVRQVSSLPAIRGGAHVDLGAIALIRQIEERGAPDGAPALLLFEWSLQTGLTVVTQHGRITFGDSDGFAFKYGVWEQLEREALRRGEPLQVADLRFGTHPRVEMGLGLGRATRIVDP